MKKTVITGTLLSALICAPLPALAADPCEVIFCMAAKVAGEGGGQCRRAEKAFLNIVKFKWKKHKGWKFNADATKEAREAFLKGCGDPDTVGEIPKIIRSFGALR